LPDLTWGGHHLPAQLFTVSAVTLSPGEADPFEHVAAILVNVTRLQRGRELLLQPGRGLLQVRPVLARCICAASPLCWAAEGGRAAALVQLLRSFRSCSRAELQPWLAPPLPQALASQLQAPSLVRRRGVAGAIRNCCISAEQDGTLEVGPGAPAACPGAAAVPTLGLPRQQ
jgi:hypothetical protein